MHVKFPRGPIHQSVLHVLSTEGKAIDSILYTKNKKHAGDESQIEFQNKPWWHTRTGLIRHVAEMLKIDPKLLGTDRPSNTFQNIIDQEISKLRKNKVIVDWNSSKHLGIFRLAEFPEEPVEKPRESMEGKIPTCTGEPPPIDTSSQNLKQKFLTIMSKSAKSNTYKFTLAKSLLDYCADHELLGNQVHEIPYRYFASRFLRYYWYQEYKYKMKQDFLTNGKPNVIQVINKVFGKNPPGDFELLDEQDVKTAENKILKEVFGSIAAKKSIVIPAFQKIPVGNGSEEMRIFYDYDNRRKILYLRPEAFEFFRKNNGMLSRVVLAEWAKFLEKTNLGLPRLVAKIEQYDVQREPLLPEYWKEYSPHFEHCFYCKDKLERDHTHVDHFIPWSYMFDNNAWNLVLSCKDCNCKKSDSLPQKEFLDMLIGRNKKYSGQIKKLRISLDQLNSGRGWSPEVKNHYENCNSYGFSIIHLP